MTTVALTEPNGDKTITNGQAFLDALPVYRFAMQFAAVNMGDLNFVGTPRTESMDWWVSHDEGIIQVSQVAEFISRFHEELLSLPEKEAAECSIGSVVALTDRLGKHFHLADMTSPEEVQALLRIAAGIRMESDGSMLLSDTPADRQARGMSATLLRDACDRVCSHVRQRFSPQDMTPKPMEPRRRTAGHALTPSL